MKLLLTLIVGFLLAIPLFSVWLLVYDRQTQSETARESIAEGWGGPQRISGPLLVIPYRATATETVTGANGPIVQSRQVWRELTLSPEVVDVSTGLKHDMRKRSIYEVVLYEAKMSGKARFAMPADLSRSGVAPADMALDRAELRFGVSDPRGLYGQPPRVALGGQPLRLQPGGGGFFAWIDATSLGTQPIAVDFSYDLRGNGRLSLVPQAGDTRWHVTSSWPHPSFGGGFLPTQRSVTADGFSAQYRIGNLALGQSLIATGDPGQREARGPVGDEDTQATDEARVELLEPVDLYAQVNRATKYGFLFIGFTFLTFLLFDVIGGVRVSSVEYLLVGVALILFFVLLLAFAEVIGFTPAYLVAGAAIVGLNTSYSAAVLKSWRRAGLVGGLLAGLYAVLYVLLSLEAYSLLIGSLMLLIALAAVMYLTRHLNWGGEGRNEALS
jgi:inner membrane protein